LRLRVLMKIEETRKTGELETPPRSQYLPLGEIPVKVHEAAETLFTFFEERGFREWQFSHVAARRLVVSLERKIEELSNQANLPKSDP